MSSSIVIFENDLQILVQTIAEILLECWFSRSSSRCFMVFR